MTNQTIKQILKKKGVSHLYHANTMITACTFIENGGLLSRGAVEDLGLSQSPQISDKIDKVVDVFYDIFFDSVDIHQRSKNVNKYGPILFVYSIDLIDTLPEDIIKVTKKNPIHWDNDMPESEKYFLSEHELDTHFIKGNFGQHITLRHQKNPLSFTKLEQIIIDNPGSSYKTYLDSSYKHLKELIKTYNLNCSLNIRTCFPTNCCCEAKYRSYQPGALYHKFHF